MSGFHSIYHTNGTGASSVAGDSTTNQQQSPKLGDLIDERDLIGGDEDEDTDVSQTPPQVTHTWQPTTTQQTDAYRFDSARTPEPTPPTTKSTNPFDQEEPPYLPTPLPTAATAMTSMNGLDDELESATNSSSHLQSDSFPPSSDHLAAVSTVATDPLHPSPNGHDPLHPSPNGHDELATIESGASHDFLNSFSSPTTATTAPSALDDFLATSNGTTTVAPSAPLLTQEEREARERANEELLFASIRCAQAQEQAIARGDYDLARALAAGTVVVPPEPTTTSDESENAEEAGPPQESSPPESPSPATLATTLTVQPSPPSSTSYNILDDFLAGFSPTSDPATQQTEEEAQPSPTDVLSSNDATPNDAIFASPTDALHAAGAAASSASSFSLTNWIDPSATAASAATTTTPVVEQSIEPVAALSTSISTATDEWTADEDAKLVSLVQEHGPQKWSIIASHLPGRIGKQCRERWHQHLNPTIQKEQTAVAPQSDETPVAVPTPSASPSTPSTTSGPSLQLADLLTSSSSTSGFHLNSTFSSCHSDALSALDALRQSIASDVLHLDEAAQAEETQFQQVRSQLQLQQQQVEEASQQLSDEKERFHQRVDGLRTQLDSSQLQLNGLTSEVQDLESKHHSLLASRRARLLSAYIISQPIHTFLKHNAGSRSGAHRAFLKEFRRQQRVAERLQGEENIHHAQSEDEREEEEERHVSTSSHVNTHPDDAHLDLNLDGITSVKQLPRRYGSFTPSGADDTPRFRLPVGTIELIWTYLGVRDLQTIACVSPHWYQLLSSQTASWKLLLQRVSGVEQRIRREREREKLAKRTAPTTSSSSLPPRQDHASTGAVTPHRVPPSTLIHAGSSSNLSQDQTPPASPGRHSRTLSFSGGAAPGTPATGGLLSGMLRRFRGSTSTPATAANAHGMLPPTTTTPPMPPPSITSSGSYAPMHLHYDLMIEIPSRDLTNLTVTGYMARTSQDGHQRCLDEFANETEKGTHSVVMHLCSLRRPHPPTAQNPAATGGSFDEELEFVRQLFALQANLTQAKMEKAKILAQIDEEEHLKKTATMTNSKLVADLHELDAELERLKQQYTSDQLTRNFLSQQVTNMLESLEHERQRTTQVELDRAEKHDSVTRDQQQQALLTQQQQELYAQLRTQKKQLSKEVRLRQTELDREQAERDLLKKEFEEMTATIAKLKGAAN